MRAHLVESCSSDGIPRPVVFGVAADPPIGPRLGIDALFAHLTSRLDEKKVHLGRVVEEARATTRKVAAVTGVSVWRFARLRGAVGSGSQRS